MQSTKAVEPKKVLLDTANRKHTADIASRTHKLNTQVSAFLDDLISIVGILWRSSIGIPLDIRRYELGEVSVPEPRVLVTA